MWRWKRDGLLSANQSFGWQWSRDGEIFASIRVRTETDQVVLTYRHRNQGKEWQDERYPVYLDRTPHDLDGERPVFSAPPVVEAGVRQLYGGGIFACRHCYQLAYHDQR